MGTSREFHSGFKREVVLLQNKSDVFAEENSVVISLSKMYYVGHVFYPYHSLQRY